MLKLVQENFKFKDNNDIEKCIPDDSLCEFEIKNPKTVVDFAEVNTGYLMMGALCDSAKNLKETIALDLISTILGDGKSSRLSLELIENVENPHYYQLESCHYQFKDGDNFLIEANFDADKKDIVIDEIKSQLQKLSTITEIELNKAKKRAKVNFAQESEMVSDIADAIGYWTTVVEDISVANKYLSTLDEIDCKYLEDIAKKYLSPEKLSVSLLLPKGEN